MSRYAICYLLAIPALTVFLIGIYSKCSLWFSGSAGGFDADETPMEFSGAVRRVVSTIFSRRVFRIASAVLGDAIMGRKLYRLSRIRWAIHSLMIYGFGCLLIADAVEVFLTYTGHGGDVKDIPALAVAFEIGGLSVVCGVFLALGRRLFLHEERLKSTASDYVAPVLMSLVLITGYLTEALRLTAECVAPALAKYSFIGLALGRALPWFAADSASSHNVVWWIHVLLSFSFIAYIPYGKFFHFLVAPIVSGMNSADEQR